MKKITYFIVIILITNCTVVLAQANNVNRYETEEYKIGFPAPPRKLTQKIASGFGELLMIIMAFEPESTANDDNHVYMIMETKYPDSTIHSDKTEILDKFFRNAIDGAVKDLKGTLINEVRGVVAKYPSRTIEID